MEHYYNQNKYKKKQGDGGVEEKKGGEDEEENIQEYDYGSSQESFKTLVMNNHNTFFKDKIITQNGGPMKHISYSELKTWAECPYKRKLSYQDRVKKFVGNQFTAFGRARHFLCENLVYDKVEDAEDFFNLSFVICGYILFHSLIQPVLSCGEHITHAS